MLIKERLILARERKELSQTDIANRLGVAPSFYCRLENGRKTCPLNVAIHIAELLEVSLDWLLGRSEQ